MYCAILLCLLIVAFDLIYHFLLLSCLENPWQNYHILYVHLRHLIMSLLAPVRDPDLDLLLLQSSLLKYPKPVYSLTYICRNLLLLMKFSLFFL